MNDQIIAKPVDILLVEDNPGDIRLTIDMFKEAKVRNNLKVVNNGEEALAYLLKRGEYTQSSYPDIILLDLNIPEKNGQEVLSEIKSHPELRKIPVIILTGSDANQDIYKSYDLHANCFVTKALDMDGFIKIIQSISNFWLTFVKFPVLH